VLNCNVLDSPNIETAMRLLLCPVERNCEGEKLCTKIKNDKERTAHKAKNQPSALVPSALQRLWESYTQGLLNHECRFSLREERISFKWSLRTIVTYRKKKVAGSIPDEVIEFFSWPNPSSRTMALGSTQPLTEWVPGIFLGVKDGRRVRVKILPPSVSRLPRICGSLDVSQTYGGLHSLLQG
jgi:hypothetical protein